MRLTIIPEDNAVYKDGYLIEGLDLTSLPSNIHAIQWYDTYGEVEYKDTDAGKSVNTVFSSLTPYQHIVDAFDTQKVNLEQSNILVSEGTK